ncbi:hypothetical protein KUTeg_006978, partial [Tegillarca granosa]
MEHRDRLIFEYFKNGLRIAEIVLVLASKHRIVISERTVKRATKRLGLFRKKLKSDICDVAIFIQENIENSGQLHGYRWMYWKCIKAGYNVSQEDVRCLLKILDSNGVEIRKRKRLHRRTYYSQGPNFMWHIDGYDKLKPYGIAIHGCIDGFSRHIIWLRARNTNNDPRVVARYYIDAIEVANGSTHNQRIEWFWGLLRRENAQFWMDTFRKIREELNAFEDDFLDKSLIRFCFLRMIQAKLDQIVSVWDVHCLQRKKNSDANVGKPFLLYNAPEMFGGNDKLCHLNADDYEICKEETVDLPDIPCDDTVYELCCLLMEEGGWDLPLNTQDGIELYMNLRNSIRSIYNMIMK